MHELDISGKPPPAGYNLALMQDFGEDSLIVTMMPTGETWLKEPIALCGGLTTNCSFLDR
jgi:hypothetical protein